MFRIYYDGNTTYDGDPYNAPCFGVLLIVETDEEHGRRIVSNGDYYVWDGRWWNKDFIGMIDYLQMPGPKKVIMGRMVPNDIWTEIYRKADVDPDFPTRLAYGAFEKIA